ncbi:MAG: toluene hydroxylase [Rhodospirillaceae bacterium]|nr:toluene hydroxylase [Rhodospirillaceae bacterium]MCY4238337.1 toluene hydroxylase [Rhodospirillaceae bacterium]
MTETAARRRTRKKTWSAFGELTGKPNDYEIVTHNMNHTTGETPLEMGPNVHGNVWLKRYRDEISIKISNWDAFRDPDRLTYDGYVKMQDEQEAYVDNLLASYTAEDSIDSQLSDNCLNLLRSVMTPSRYLAHVQQMLSAYIHQLAPSSYIGNCAGFQVADQLRRVQRVAYRTRQLDTEHPTHGFGSSERETWENAPGWQGVREAVEKLMIAYKWDEALVAFNLVIRPVCDNLFVNQLSRAARLAGDELDALVFENLYVDCERHNRWTVSATTFIIDEDPAHRETLRNLAGGWNDLAETIVQSGAAMIAEHVDALEAQTIAEDVLAKWVELKWQAGLSGNA